MAYFQTVLMVGAGGAIFLTVMAFNLVGDGIREAMDPKIRWRFQKN